VSNDATHPNAVLLRTLYSDLTQIRRYAADDIAYHLAGRDSPGSPATLRGVDAAEANERAFLHATAGSLTPLIEHVTANDYFGTVTGTFHAVVDDRPWTMPFCGVWRFRDGKITDHWQNAYDPAQGVLLSL